MSPWWQVERIQFLMQHVPDHVVEDSTVAEIHQLHVCVKPDFCLESEARTQLKRDTRR